MNSDNSRYFLKHGSGFADVPEDADAGIPKVEDARKRLAGLQDR